MKAYISSRSNINVSELLEQLREDVRTIEFDTKEFAYSVFISKEIQDFIVEANIRLLEKGIRPDLSPIDKTPIDNQKSKFYERKTIYNRTEGKDGYKQSQAFFVDLYKTGLFYKSLKVRGGSSELLEFSTDPKSVELQAIWGDILGISNEDVNELLQILRPKIINFVKKKLKLRK